MDETAHPYVRLARQAIRHYATTGDRIHIDLAVTGERPFTKFEADPKVFDTASASASKLQMGEIASTSNGQNSTHRRQPLHRSGIKNTVPNGTFARSRFMGIRP